MGQATHEGLVLGAGALLMAVAACGLAAEEPEVDPGEVEAGSPPRTCATPDPGDAMEPRALLAPAATFEPVTIEVHFHVLMSSVGEGAVPDAVIRDQMQVLRDAFAGTGFDFALHSVTRALSSTWFTMTPGSAAEAAAKQHYHRGTASDLNLYTAKPGGGTLGWATYPWQVGGDLTGDGVVLLYRTMPGGEGAPFDEGDTATHEVGHWLGLHHTFLGGCSKQNDSVGDTNAESGPAFGCPFGRDTCTDLLFPGPDPVENFMDFANDSCMVLFTAGQAERMQDAWQTYRAGG